MGLLTTLLLIVFVMAIIWHLITSPLFWAFVLFIAVIMAANRKL